MIRTPFFAALAAVLALAACDEPAEEGAVAEPAVTQDTGFGGDIAAATREAAADTQAAAREAGTMDAPVAAAPPMPAAEPAVEEPAVDAPDTGDANADPAE